MTNNDHTYCVILAGGKGRRLWPCSREHHPKQFIDFFGVGRTQLQQTFDRFAKILPKDHILINTNEMYAHLVREQLPELPEKCLMVEPIYRNTAPSVAWAAHRVKHFNKDANLIVAPSDHSVQRDDIFKKNILEGISFVESHDTLLTMGVKPTRPEPGYGYVQLGEEVEKGLFHVKSFTEKPDRDFARMFMESGEFYWNTGLFMSNVRYLLKCFEELLPVVLRQLDVSSPHYSISEENEYIETHFPLYPNLSIEYGILEKSENVYVKKCDFGWADLGAWHSIYEALQKVEDDNVVIDSDVLIDDCHNNIIKLSKGKFAVLNGLNGFIVAENDNMLLVCKKEDSSALVRKYVNEVHIKKGGEYI
ncbi:MAG: mannose-1-phosphate guanylyltransferase [Prevotella sp.]|nr:mannose-1-phosphate guanylyltransferase [Prevotella sp.]